MEVVDDSPIEGDSLIERKLNLLLNGQHSDCVLPVKFLSLHNESCLKEYHVHMLTLAAASPVFNQMFYGPSSDNTQPLEIKEASPIIFDLLLKFAYTNTVNLAFYSDAEKISLVKLAHEYKIFDLVNICGQSLIPSICCCTAFEILNLAVEFNVYPLRDECINFIKYNTKQVFKPNYFNCLTPEALGVVLQQDELDVQSELIVYKLVVIWAYVRLNNKLEKEIDEMKNCIVVGSDSANLELVTYINEAAIRAHMINQNLSNILMSDTLEEKDRHKIPIGLDSVETAIVKINQVNAVAMYNQNQWAERIIYSTTPNDGEFKELYHQFPENVYAESTGPRLREIMEECGIIKHIRFLSLDPTDFANYIASDHILTEDEVMSVLLFLNSSKRTQLPPGVCPLVLPRRQTTQPEKKLYVMACVNFLFVHPHSFEILPFENMEEMFYCTSERPLLLRGVTIPPKAKRTLAVMSQYSEEITIIVDTVTPTGEKIDRIASCSYRVRRKFNENKEYPLIYSMSDNGGLLLKGTFFKVTLFFARGGLYSGGFEYITLNKTNELIGVPENKTKGMVRGLSFEFIF